MQLCLKYKKVNIVAKSSTGNPTTLQLTSLVDHSRPTAVAGCLDVQRKGSLSLQVTQAAWH